MRTIRFVASATVESPDVFLKTTSGAVPARKAAPKPGECPNSSGESLTHPTTDSRPWLLMVDSAGPVRLRVSYHGLTSVALKWKSNGLR